MKRLNKAIASNQTAQLSDHPCDRSSQIIRLTVDEAIAIPYSNLLKRSFFIPDALALPDNLVAASMSRYLSTATNRR